MCCVSIWGLDYTSPQPEASLGTYSRPQPVVGRTFEHTDSNRASKYLVGLWRWHCVRPPLINPAGCKWEPPSGSHSIASHRWGRWKPPGDFHSTAPRRQTLISFRKGCPWHAAAGPSRSVRVRGLAARPAHTCQAVCWAAPSTRTTRIGPCQSSSALQARSLTWCLAT